jgi:hypothetical protein
MKKYSSLSLILFAMFFSLWLGACISSGPENFAPKAVPVAAYVGRDSAIVQWGRNPGNWKYDLSLVRDSIPNDSSNIANTVQVTDTFYIFTNLKPATPYNLIITTFPLDSSSSYAPSDGSPLKFHTKE